MWEISFTLVFTCFFFPDFARSCDRNFVSWRSLIVTKAKSLLVRGLEISPKNSSAKFTQTFCHKNSMARGCADSPKLNLSDFMWIKVLKRCCSSFNALSIMEVIIRIEKGFYPKHHLVQLHPKPITTTKGLITWAGLLWCGLPRLSCNREVDFCCV